LLLTIGKKTRLSGRVQIVSSLTRFPKKEKARLGRASPFTSLSSSRAFNGNLNGQRGRCRALTRKETKPEKKKPRAASAGLV